MDIKKIRLRGFTIKSLSTVLCLTLASGLANSMETRILTPGRTVMKNLLVISSSPKTSGSDSRNLLNQLSESLTTKFPSSYSVRVRDLNQTDLPCLNDSSLEVITTGKSTMASSLAFKKASDILISEVREADAIAVAAPMHNFTVSDSLKRWIDLVLIAGQTFTYTEQGPKGLLKDRPSLLIHTSGGFYKGTEFDHLTPYMRLIFNFIGIRNFTSIAAEGLAIPGKREDSLAAAKEELEKYAERLAKDSFPIAS